MAVPRLGVKSELQLLAFAQAIATASATPDPSHVCDLYHTAHSNARCPHPLSKARDQTCILKDTDLRETAVSATLEANLNFLLRS